MNLKIDLISKCFVAIITLISFYFFFVNIGNLPILPHTDTHYFSNLVSSMGLNPFEDFLIRKTPGEIYLQSALFKIIPHSLYTVKAIEIILLSIICLSLYKQQKKKNDCLIVLGSLSLVLFSYSSKWDHLALSTEFLTSILLIPFLFDKANRSLKYISSFFVTILNPFNVFLIAFLANKDERKGLSFATVLSLVTYIIPIFLLNNQQAYTSYWKQYYFLQNSDFLLARGLVSEIFSFGGSGLLFISLFIIFYNSKLKSNYKIVLPIFFLICNTTFAPREESLFIATGSFFIFLIILLFKLPRIETANFKRSHQLIIMATLLVFGIKESAFRYFGNKINNKIYHQSAKSVATKTLELDRESNYLIIDKTIGAAIYSKRFIPNQFVHFQLLNTLVETKVRESMREDFIHQFKKQRPKWVIIHSDFYYQNNENKKNKLLHDIRLFLERFYFKYEGPTGLNQSFIFRVKEGAFDLDNILRLKDN